MFDLYYQKKKKIFMIFINNVLKTLVSSEAESEQNKD